MQGTDLTIGSNGGVQSLAQGHLLFTDFLNSAPDAYTRGKLTINDSINKKALQILISLILLIIILLHVFLYEV